jgi:hypothetical protein
MYLMIFKQTFKKYTIYFPPDVFILDMLTTLVKNEYTIVISFYSIANDAGDFHDL